MTHLTPALLFPIRIVLELITMLAEFSATVTDKILTFGVGPHPVIEPTGRALVTLGDEAVPAELAQPVTEAASVVTSANVNLLNLLLPQFGPPRWFTAIHRSSRLRASCAGAIHLSRQVGGCRIPTIGDEFPARERVG